MPSSSHRPHYPFLDELESVAKYLQRQQDLQQEEDNVESAAGATLNHSRSLDTHLLPTAQVAPSPNKGNSGKASQIAGEDSIAVPQSPHPSEFPSVSNILTQSEGGRPVVFKFAPLEQGTSEKSCQSEPVGTELLDARPEAVNTKGNICIKGLDNEMYFCYQNSVIQMLCASDTLREKFQDHFDAIDEGFQSTNSSRGTHRSDAPSCCAHGGCFLCALGWVVVNHQFPSYESGPTGPNPVPLNDWVHDFRTLTSIIGYDGAEQHDASEYLMEIIVTMSNLGEFSKPIVDVLTGSYPSMVRCPKCNCESVTRQELRMLQLHYPPKATGPVEIEDLLDVHFRTEKVDSTCGACSHTSSDSGFLKMVRVDRAPSFLVLSVARYHDHESLKLMGALKIKEYLALGSDSGPIVYALKAVVCHGGGSRTLYMLREEAWRGLGELSED